MCVVAHELMGQQAVPVSGSFAHTCGISCEPGHTVLMTVAGSVPRWGSAGYRLVWVGHDQDNRTLVLQQAGRPQSWCSVMALKQVARPARMKERAIDSIAFGEGLQSDGAERGSWEPSIGVIVSIRTHGVQLL